jgi:hypothetical protein
MALLVTHHNRFGYRHCVINHRWRALSEPADLRRRVESEDLRRFTRTRSLEDHLQRTVQRARTRATDDVDDERQAVIEEWEALRAWSNGEPGKSLEVNAAPAELVETLMHRLRIR